MVLIRDDTLIFRVFHPELDGPQIMVFVPNLKPIMLTDTKLRNLKPKDKQYKVNDRDGLYVAVTAAGAISFRYNCSIHVGQETITFGRYAVGGITLSEARERLGEAKKMIAAGKSPAKEKARDKARIKDAETFDAWVENGCVGTRWLTPRGTCGVQSTSAS